MNYKIIQPPLQLADYVRFFWFLEIDSSTDTPFVHHAFAHHCPEIIFCYKGQFKYKSGFETEKKLIAGIFGQTQTFSKVASSADFGVLGFYLYPYAFAQLFSILATELTNHTVDMKTLCGKAGEILEEKIMLANDNDERLKLVCDFLKCHLKNVRSESTRICSSIFQTVMQKFPRRP